jgi:hypothetical protein
LFDSLASPTHLSEGQQSFHGQSASVQFAGILAAMEFRPTADVDEVS